MVQYLALVATLIFGQSFAHASTDQLLVNINHASDGRSLAEAFLSPEQKEGYVLPSWSATRSGESELLRLETGLYVCDGVFKLVESKDPYSSDKLIVESLDACGLAADSIAEKFGHRPNPFYSH